MKVARAMLIGASVTIAGLASFAEHAPTSDSGVPSLAKVNYAEYVAPILNAHCVECHRPGEVAPFSLLGYDNAKKWARMASTVTESGQMPPWKAVHGYGDFLDENRLTPAEVETIKRWNSAGAPRGDPKSEPASPKFAGEWPLGKPDLVMEAPKAFKIGKEGHDIYRNFVMDYDFKEPVWVTAMTVKPGNPRDRKSVV